jgi:uncharacterized protein (UPF0332 family)
MNARDFLTVAKAWLAETAEASWRSAVSHAYYAAFHVARELLEGLRFMVPQGDRAHAYLWLRLSNCGDRHLKDIGQRLNDLRRWRNRADYDMLRHLSQAFATSTALEAEQIILALDAVVEPTRTRITDAMMVYERDVLKDITWRP